MSYTLFNFQSARSPLYGQFSFGVNKLPTVRIKLPVVTIEWSFQTEAVDIIGVTDANGNSTRTDYDAEGRKTRDVDADGVAITYSYGADGRPTGSTDAAGNTTTFIYVNPPGSNATTPGVQAGLEGLLAAVLYPTYREDYRYDVRNRQTQIIQNLNTNPTTATTLYTTTTQYDAAGNPVKRIDPKGNATTTD